MSRGLEKINASGSIDVDSESGETEGWVRASVASGGCRSKAAGAMPDCKIGGAELGEWVERGGMGVDGRCV